ncbi:MAG: hydroxymethylglutaryl-CoA reductase [Candidatus Marinimicrobia bacterium]|nr:hydroxymethylglutaryl-CoA reductase [Candidatus Neomarinimicrobiota bacterium]
MVLTTPHRGYSRKDTDTRKKWLAKHTGIELDDTLRNEPEDLKGIIENHVGFMNIPMAIASPLVINGSYAKGEFCVPICTLEGTLALSMSRGMLATALSGGITTRHIKQELSRSPVFIFETIDESGPFLEWVNKQHRKIKKVAESTTKHGKLLRIDKYTSHNTLILDFVYYTAEASGQNMVTIATSAACKYIQENYSSKNGFRYLIESNFNSDKNPAYKTLLLGRGHHVVASTIISNRTLKRIFRSSTENFLDGYRQLTIGSLLAGVVGLNLHVANALTAIYLATGQDTACVSENSIGIMTCEMRNGDDLFLALSMPSITVGTVGGGTRLVQQKKNLEILGCTGKNSSKKLAEIICASALALELSLGGAILSNEFAVSHLNYGR